MSKTPARLFAPARPIAICFAGLIAACALDARADPGTSLPASVSEALARSQANARQNPADSLKDADAALAQVSRVMDSPDKLRAEVEAGWLRAQALYRLNRLDEAENIASEALKKSENLDRRNSLRAQIMYTYAIISERKGNISVALNNLSDSYRIFQDINDRDGKSKSLLMIASIYRQSGNNKTAIQYFEKTIIRLSTISTSFE